VGPGVVLLAGLPGSGKTTLARALLERLPDARLLDKDLVRDALFAPCDYDPAEREVSVEAMVAAAGYHLARARTVLLDGIPAPSPELCRRTRALAARTGAWWALLRCDVPMEVAVARCEADRAAGRHPAANRDRDLVARVAAELATVEDEAREREMVGPAAADEAGPDAAVLRIDLTLPVRDAADRAVRALVDRVASHLVAPIASQPGHAAR